MIEEVNVNFNGTMIHGIKIKKRTNGTANAVYQFNIPYIAGSNTLSFYAMIDPASVVENGYIRAYITSYSSYPINSKEWTHIKHTEVKANSGTATIHITQYSPDYDVIIIFPQFEQKPYPTSFIDGTRAAETLTIPTEGVLNPREGTIEISIMKPKYLNYNARVLWAEKGSSRFGIHDNPSGGLAWAYNSTDTQLGAGQLLEGQWHYLAMSWNRDEGWAKCYVDGKSYQDYSF